MAGKRKGQRMLGEIQRLKAMGFGKKAVARTLGISRNTLKKYWESPEERTAMDNTGGSPAVYRAAWSDNVDWKVVGEAVGRGQALSHYWERFLEGRPLGDPLRQVPYVSFWREYKRRFPQVSLAFHRTHPPGACCEADYKGRRPGLGYWDPAQGTFVVCELFGAVLGFSQYLSVDVTRTQQKGDFLGSMDRAYRAFGGIPRITVTDNLKTAVNRGDRYDPDVNPDFTGFCRHYGTVAIPTRPRKPKDKNLIEGALGLFWRWIRADLSRQRFISLSALRAFVLLQADRFNGRVQRRYGQSRRQRLEEERTVLAPVPDEPYEVCCWKKAKLHADCHVQVAKNFYSAPFTLRGQVLEVRITATAIELFYRQERVAVHVRQPSTSRDGIPPMDAICPRPKRRFSSMSPNGFGKSPKRSVRKQPPWWTGCSPWAITPCAISVASRGCFVLPGRCPSTVWNRRSGPVGSSGKIFRAAGPWRG